MSPICSFDAYHLKQDREYLFRVTPRNKYGWGEVEMTPRPTRIGRTIEQPILPRTLPRQVRCMPGGSVSLDAQVGRGVTLVAVKRGTGPTPATRKRRKGGSVWSRLFFLFTCEK